VLALADKGWRQALQDNVHLRNGLNVCKGKVTYEAVARAHGYDYQPAEMAIA
jgi:alanine dehydrogenase